MPPSRKFNQKTGLVYSEQILQAPNPSRSSFLYKCRGRKPTPTTKTQNGHGVASLEDVALHSILCHLDFVTPGALGAVPELLMKRVWEGVLRSSLNSVRTWQLFTLALAPDDNPGNHSRRVPNPEPRIGPYLAISSTTGAWLSSLTICDHSFPAEDLFALAHVRSLTYLHLASSERTAGEGVVVVDDGVLRGWARLARGGSGAFGGLRELVLRGQKGVTGRCFEYLSRLPVLVGVCVSLCGMDEDVAVRAAGECGWECTTGGFYKHVKGHVDNAASTHREMEGWLTLVDQYVLDQHSTSAANSKPNIPLLSVSLGRESQNSRRLNSMEGIQWFERTKGAAEKTKAADKPVLVRPEVTKRRKIRDTRKLDPMDMLGSW